MKQLWKAGLVLVALLVVAGVAIGVVSAQSDDGDTPTGTTEVADATAVPNDGASATPAGKDALRDTFLDELAKQLGVTRDALDTALKQTGLEMVDRAVEAGKLTEDEANKIRERINSGEGFPFFGFPGRGHGPGFGHRGFAYDVFGGVADFLGISNDDLRSALKEGQSLAQIADDNGNSRDELTSYLTTEFNDEIDAKVNDGKLTQERADEMKQNFADHIGDLIDHTGFPGPGRRGGMTTPPDASLAPSGTTSGLY